MTHLGTHNPSYTWKKLFETVQDSIYLDQWFSTGILPPGTFGHVYKHFLLPHLGVAVTLLSSGRGQGADKHPTKHGTAFPTKNYWDQSVNSAKVEKRQHRYEIFQPLYLQSWFFSQGTTFPGKHGDSWFLVPPDFLGFLLPFSLSWLNTELVSGLGAGVPYSGIHANWNSLTLWLFPSPSLLSCLDVGGFAFTHILQNLLPMSSPNVWTQTARTDYLFLCFMPYSLFPGGSKYKKSADWMKFYRNAGETLVCPCQPLAIYVLRYITVPDVVTRFVMKGWHWCMWSPSLGIHKL